MQLMGFPFWEISYLYVDNNAHDKLTKVSQGRVLLMKQNPNRRFYTPAKFWFIVFLSIEKKSTTFSEHFHIYYRLHDLKSRMPQQ